MGTTRRTAKAALSPRKAPVQNRSAATVAVILQAAARVLARESLAGFNTNRVAAVAGVSVGSLYQYFPNKTALVVALIVHKQTILAEQVNQAVERAQGLSLAAALLSLAELAVAQQFDDPLLAAALDHEEQRLAAQPALRTALQAAQGQLLAAVGRLLRWHRASLAPRLPSLAAMDCLTITQALVDSSQAHSAAERSALARRVQRALLGYLTVQSTV
jgi:AcrR family transcriptional regulator